MNRVLITGAAGFVGSNLAKRFVECGWDVSVVDDMSAGEPSFIPDGVKFRMVADFASKNVLNMVRNQEFDVVAHLAAKPRVSFSVEQPLLTHDVNVNKTLQLMDACRGNVRRFINTSSSSVYGGATCLPTLESMRHNPKSPYALQKSITEQYCTLYSQLYNLDTVSVRPFNVFGPNQKGDNPYATAIGAWLHAVKHGKPLRSDGDGEQTRDMTYVDNVVDIFIKCAEFNDSFHGEAFNAGTGASVSNNEILSWFKTEYPTCAVNHVPERLGDVKHTQASTVQAEKLLGYKVIVPFWQGLENTREWAMSNPLF